MIVYFSLLFDSYELKNLDDNRLKKLILDEVERRHYKYEDLYPYTRMSTCINNLWSWRKYRENNSSLCIIKLFVPIDENNKVDNGIKILSIVKNVNYFKRINPF